VPIYRRPIDKWAQAQFGIWIRTHPGDKALYGWALISTCFLKYGVIHAYSRKLRLCPFIARPPMDGHISGTMRKPVKFSFQFIARLPMDGHISGTMRKPVKFSFQNIRQN